MSQTVAGRSFLGAISGRLWLVANPKTCGDGTQNTASINQMLGMAGMAGVSYNYICHHDYLILLVQSTLEILKSFCTLIQLM